jgi:phytoene dehydrogenase-like protein
MHDVAVIGSGFGGLATALRCAELGRSVVLFEMVNYPGGCASTHTRRGVRFESGATLLAGLGPGQLFASWLERHGVSVPSVPLDPVLTQVIDGVSVPLPPSRQGWAAQLGQLPGVDEGRVHRFLDLQRRVAAPLWDLFQHPERLPPFDGAAVSHHLGRLGRYLPVGGVVGRTLGAVLDRHGLRDPTLRRLFDGLCQITVQTTADRADAVFAMGALEVFFGGAAHVHGGVGVLAEAIVQALQRAGGEVHYAHRVKRLTRRARGYTVHTSRGDWDAEQVVANVLPQQLLTLTDLDTPRLRRLRERVRRSWGAAVRFRTLRDDPTLPSEGFHRQLVGDQAIDGHSAWVSVGGRGEGRDGERTLVASTHLDADASPEQVQVVQQRIADTLARLAPDLTALVTDDWTASPRTFERFTRRTNGFVGGVPRTVDPRGYLGLWPRPEARGLWLVGDSVLYGQSTLATAVSGHRVADALMRR